MSTKPARRVSFDQEGTCAELPCPETSGAGAAALIVLALVAGTTLLVRRHRAGGDDGLTGTAPDPRPK